MRQESYEWFIAAIVENNKTQNNNDDFIYLFF